MLEILTAGIPLSAKEILSKAAKEVFGEVDIKEADTDRVRFAVRVASRDLNTTLIVLDGVSQDICKNEVKDLLNGDKYYCYNNDRDFTLYLNKLWNLNLEVPEDEENLVVENVENSGVSTEEYNLLKAQISDLKSINNSLHNQITELRTMLESDCDETEKVDSAEVEKLKNDVESAVRDSLKAKNQLLDVEKKLKESEERVASLEKDRSSLTESNRSLESKNASILADFKSLSDELTEYKVNYSTQYGVVRAKDAEISSLRKQLSLLENNQIEVNNAKEREDSYKKSISDLHSEISKLKVELSSKEEEILRLSKEIEAKGIESDLVDTLKRDIEDLTNERDNALNRVSALEDSLSASQSATQSEKITVSELQEKVEELTDKVKDDEESLISLNKENLELKNKVSVFEKSRDRNEDMESILEELADIRQKYDRLAGGVFSKIASTALPRGSSAIHLTRGGVKLSNIRFVFSGNAESRKGTYRCLLNEFKKYNGSGKILIVDVVSETSIDYVFEIRKVVSGLDWFRRGGSVQQYLSETCLKNVQVLSPGLNYINDSYYLTVDWESRLSELEKSGYSVVVYCGDISNIVGRVMHESFADLGSSWIYVQGNAIGSRTIVSNLRGLSNSKKSIVAYFDYNKQMDKFYRLVMRSNDCRILSLVGGYQQ